MRYVTYSEKENNIVEKGLIEIQKILMGTDDEEFNMGEFPQSAIVVYNTEGTEEGNGYD